MAYTYTINDLASHDKAVWCPGCGDFAMLMAVKKALIDLKLEPHKVMMVSGIGCGSKFPHLLSTYGFHGIHGRTMPFAAGLKLANHDLTVIITAGDGDTYGIGGNHYIHGLRRNLDITLLVQNNMVYGLTKGQTSPTSQVGFVSKSSPHGNVEDPINPLLLALASGATFVARTFVGEMAHMTDIIRRAIAHRGSSVVDILMPCVSFNKLNTLQWFRERVYRMEDHDASDLTAAARRALETERIPLGVFYEVQKPTLWEQLPQIKETPLVRQDISSVDISKSMEHFV